MERRSHAPSAFGTLWAGFRDWLAAAWRGTEESGAPSACPEAPPVVVHETNRLMEAEVLRGLLTSNGIPAMIQKESVSQAYPFTVGNLADCQILVPAALAAEAEALLRERYDVLEIPERQEEDSALPAE